MNETRRNILRKASALGALALGASATASAADCSGIPEWDSSTAYNGGDQVTYEGDLFTAEWWTQGSEPDGSKSVWTNEGPCDGGGGGGGGGGGDGDQADCSGVAAYDASTAYSGGDTVTYENSLWKAEWWTQGTAPAESENVWTLLGACNQGPTASFSVSPSNPAPGESATFDASGSSDPDGSISSYDWTIDGTSASGQTVTQTFQNEGFYTVQLTVTDDAGVSATTSQELTVGDPNLEPSASITAPDFANPGETITLDGSGSSDPDGSISSYEWDLGDGTTASGESVTHSYGSEGQYTVTLTVTDADGATATAEATVGVGVATGDQRVVAYYRQWSQYDREYLPADIPFDEITHAQYAFGRPEKDGSLNLVGGSYGQQVFYAEEDWQGPDRGKTFSGYARERDDVTFLLSIGGWGDSEYFSPVAQDPAKRETFAQECADIVTKTGIDGVDIDWEYPGGGGCTAESPVCDIDNISQPGDQEKYTLLLQDIRAALDEAQANNPDRDEPYVLTAAQAAAPGKVEGLEHQKLSDVLDFVSIMTFDYRGIWSDYTGHQAPLGEDPDSPLPKADTWNAQYALQYYVDQGWDPQQLNMAVPFYGRSWTDVQQPESGVGSSADDGLHQPYSGEDEDASGDGSYPGPGQQGTSLGGVWDAFDLIGDGRTGSNPVNLDGANWETYFDEDAASSWSFNSESRLMITHPTTQSMEAKGSWLSNSPYGGTMLWAIGADTKEGTLITALWDALNG